MSPSLKKMTKIIGLNLRVSNGFDLIKLRISLKNLSLKYSNNWTLRLNYLTKEVEVNPVYTTFIKRIPFPLLVPSLLIMFFDHIFAKITIKFSPNRMNMVTVVSRVIVFDQKVLALDTVVVRF